MGNVTPLLQTFDSVYGIILSLERVALVSDASQTRADYCLLTKNLFAQN